MMAANGAQQKRDLPSRVSSSIALLGISAAALIALDLWHFTLATGVGALALAAFVAAYIVRQPGPRFGLYTFLVAEVSAISLGADLVTALTVPGVFRPPPCRYYHAASSRRKAPFLCQAGAFDAADRRCGAGAGARARGRAGADGGSGGIALRGDPHRGIDHVNSRQTNHYVDMA